MSKKARKIKVAVAPAPDTEVLDDAAAAALLRTKPRTLRLWRQTRGLPHFKPTGRIILYRRSDLLAWLEKFRCQRAA
jgi:hypothetical protein